MINRIFFRLAAISLVAVFSASGLYAQPEFRSDAHREFDEDGNMIYFDSCWSWHHSGPSSTFDSLFHEFLENHPFAFEFSPGHFPDSSLDLSPFFGLPDSIWGHPHPFLVPPSAFDPFLNFSDSAWRSGHGYDLPRQYIDSLFSRPYPGPFYHGYDPDDLYEDFPFRDFEKFFEEQMEFMKKYFREHPFPGDSIPYFSPRWQHLPNGPPDHPPGSQKKSPRSIDI